MQQVIGQLSAAAFAARATVLAAVDELARTLDGHHTDPEQLDASELAAAQAQVIEKVARTLKPHGRFLFTAHKEPVEWLDAMTGRPSRSLGAATYERLLHSAGLLWVGEAQDEGDNYYYFVEKAG